MASAGARAYTAGVQGAEPRWGSEVELCADDQRAGGGIWSSYALRPAAAARRAIFIGGGGVAFLVGGGGVGGVSNQLTSGLEKNLGFLGKSC